MLIDWFIVVAQIINFLILVALLRWVLYRPILRVLRNRRETIRHDLEAAEAMKEEARRERDSQSRLRHDLEQRRRSLEEEARREVEERRRLDLQRLRADLEEFRRRWRDEALREEQAFLGTVRRRLGMAAGTIARRALTDLADADLEAQVVQVFLRRLAELGPEQRAALAAGGSGEAEPLVVRTSFALPPHLQRQLLDALEAAFPPLGPVQLSHDPDGPFGIEVRRAGMAIGWGLEPWLDGIERQLSGLLEKELGERPAAAPAPPADRSAAHGPSTAPA